MIKGVHAMFYTSRPDELRAFLRDTLDLSTTDVGGGWLIFDIPDAEIGCHPADLANGAPSGMNHISFYCDDIEKTVLKLKKRGVEFTSAIEDHGYGLVTHFRVPGDFTVQLFQPRYKRKSQTKKPAKRPSAKKAKSLPKKRVKK